MGQTLRTRYLMAAFTLSLCTLGAVASGSLSAQMTEPTDATATIIDDGDAQYAHTNFASTSFIGAYGEDVSYFYPPTMQAGTSALAQWTFKNVQPGQYVVRATWKKHSAFTKDAKYGVKLASSNEPFAKESLDQSREPEGEMYKKKAWVTWEEIELLNADDVLVTLEPGTDATRYTVADAVMLQRVSDGDVVNDPSCPTPVCAAPPAGCTYVSDSAVGPNGCPLRPCGELKCEPVRPSAPACGNGVFDAGEQCDLGTPGQTTAIPNRPGYFCTTACTVQEPKVACNDGVDNDGDGKIDMADGGCSQPNDKSEADGTTDLSVVLTTVPGPIPADSAYGVIMTVNNLGKDTATTQVSFTTNVPAGTLYEPQNSAGTCTEANGLITCTVDRLSIGIPYAMNLTFRTKGGSSCIANVKHIANVSASPQGDPNTSNNSSTISQTVTCSPSSACTDTDGGNKPDAYGKVTTSGGQIGDDACTNEGGPNGLFEYYCDAQNAMQRVTATCQYGCMAGACKPKPVASVCSAPVATGAVGQNQKLTTDVNNDGVTDARDLNEIIAYYRERTPVAGRFYDVDGSASFDVQDILLVINYNRCVQQNPPTTIEPGATIKLTNAALSCVSGASQFSVSYTTKGITNGFLHLLSPDGTQLTQTQLNANASSVTISPTPAGVAPGSSVKVCASTDYSLCSPVTAVTGTACAAKDTVTLTSVVLSKQGTDDVAKVTYEKNFDTCVHMLNAAGAIQHRQNHFCAKSGTITVKLSAGLTVKEGDSVKLCHGNNYGLCSAVVKVTKEATVTDSVSLSSVVMTCRDGADYANVSYKKNFATCAHLKNAAGVNFGTQNFFCDNETSKLVKASDLPGLALGTQVKLCHGNNAGVCSQLVTVTGTTCTATIAPVLNVAVKSIGSTDVAVKNSKNVNLLRFEALAANGTYISQSQDVLLTKAVFRAAAGSLLNGQNYTLWFDSNKDNVVDTILQKGAIVQNNLVTFDNLAGGGAYLTKEEPVLFEVHADIASSLTNNALQLEFATSTANYLEAENPSDGAPLTGIKTNGACGGAKCDVIVTTVPSKAFTLVNQGDLFVTLDSTPSRSRQLLGGTLGDTILRMQFRAQHEDIDVTDLQITSRGSDASSIDRLELYKDGATTAFATATVSGCGSDDVIRTDGGIAVSVFCANMENAQLIVPDGQNLDVLVRPRMKSDEQGALSGQDIRLFVSQTAVSDNATGRGAVRARGRESSSNLMANDNDATNEGEVFIGTDNGATNMEITGNRNTVSLSKITSITNANPDADNANVPTGVSPVGQFRFTAASNANTLNGLNKVSLRKLTFTVSTTNVPLDTSAFKFYNKADSSSKTACTVASGGGVGGVGGGNINMTYEVECASIANTAIDGELESGESSTFVLEAKILNPNTSTTSSSSLQVSLKNFALAFQPTSGIEWQDKDAGSVGNGTTTSSLFNWFEYSDTVVRSTLYKS